MPKIPNWSRIDSGSLTRAWEHDETGETVAVTEKVPNDGYYVMRYDGEVNRGYGDRIGYSHLKNIALRIASDKLRDRPEGWKNL